jgi:acetyltransferase EpsM
MIVIGKNLIQGKFCDLEATPFNTEFRDGRRVLTPAEKGVIIGDDVTLGSHVIINRGVNRPTRIGNRVYIWHKSVIGHDCVISDDVCLGVDVDVSGVVEVGDYSYVGVGAKISPRVKIGRYCMIGAASNVTHDVVIPDGELWFGNPARFQRVNEWRPPV